MKIDRTPKKSVDYTARLAQDTARLLENLKARPPAYFGPADDVTPYILITPEERDHLIAEIERLTKRSR